MAFKDLTKTQEEVLNDTELHRDYKHLVQRKNFERFKKEVKSKIVEILGGNSNYVTIQWLLDKELRIAWEVSPSRNITYDILEKLSKALDTKLIDIHTQNYPGTCNTCDYGAYKEIYITIRDIKPSF